MVCHTDQIRIAHIYNSIDGSKKYLLKLNDGSFIESVYIPQSNNEAKLCISNQVGCTNKCAYCATGMKEYTRDMTTSEIVSQVFCIYEDNQDFLREEVRMGILFMGMGEPFFNYDNVISAIECLQDNPVLSILPGDIIVSTSGIIPKMRTFAKEKFRTRLAVSINATDSPTRDKIMPINKIYPLDELLRACLEYTHMSDDRIIVEYVIIKSFNDGLEDAEKLADLVKPMNCEIHLIPFNETKNIRFEKPEQETVKRFYGRLTDKMSEVFLKASYGIDVCGGCGQLGGEYSNGRIAFASY